MACRNGLKFETRRIPVEHIWGTFDFVFLMWSFRAFATKLGIKYHLCKIYKCYMHCYFRQSAKGHEPLVFILKPGRMTNTYHAYIFGISHRWQGKISRLLMQVMNARFRTIYRVSTAKCNSTTLSRSHNVPPQVT